MSCVLSSGMPRDCSDSLGGIEEVLISERDNITAFTQSGHEISAITQAGATNFYRYNLKNIFEFQLIKYHVGGNYNWHIDYGIAPDKRFVRKLSMTIQLSDPNCYEGGELQLVDYGNHLVMMEKHLGRVLIFDAKIKFFVCVGYKNPF